MSQLPRSCEWPGNRLGTGSRRRSAAGSGCTRLRSFEDRVGQLARVAQSAPVKELDLHRAEELDLHRAEERRAFRSNWPIPPDGHRLANDCRAPLDGEQDTVCCTVEVGSYQGPRSARPATRVSLRCGPRRCFAVTGSLCSAPGPGSTERRASPLGRPSSVGAQYPLLCLAVCAVL